MKKAVIWDLDGTLFDSYGLIVESLHLAFKEYGIVISYDEIHRHAIEFSIQSLLSKASAGKRVTAEMLHQRYSQLSQSKYLSIKPMPHAIAVLQSLNERGTENYIFTHRGKTALPVLENLGMKNFFVDILTSQSGFARKPDPEGIRYLMRKHGLSADSTYYIGDRSIDMDCAKNAGIPGILFLPEGSIDVSGGSEIFIVKSLPEILKIV